MQITIENDPDRDIEIFWFGLKNSMENFYKLLENNKYRKPLDYWSFILNNYKKLQKYDSIEKEIHMYISLYALDIIRSFNIHHFKILETNIKRWKKILQQNQFSDTYTNYENIVYFVFDIVRNLMKKYKNSQDECIKNKIYLFCKEIDVILIYQNYSKIIDLSIKFEMPSLIDKLGKYIDVLGYIHKNYVIYTSNKNIYTFPEKISGKKIIEIMKDKTLEKILNHSIKIQ